MCPASGSCLRKAVGWVQPFKQTVPRKLNNGNANPAEAFPQLSCRAVAAKLKLALCAVHDDSCNQCPLQELARGWEHYIQPRGRHFSCTRWFFSGRCMVLAAASVELLCITASLGPPDEHSSSGKDSRAKSAAVFFVSFQTQTYIHKYIRTAFQEAAPRNQSRASPSLSHE